MTIKQAIQKYNASGRVAFHHPKLKTVSLNGFPPISEREAIARISAMFQGSCQLCGCYHMPKTGCN